MPGSAELVRIMRRAPHLCMSGKRNPGEERGMASASSGTSAAAGPWAGGYSGPGISDLGGAVLIASELPQAGTGVLVSYSGGQFIRRFWSTGPLVPEIVEILTRHQVNAIRDQVAAQLMGPGSGLDDIPLRTFVETVRMYFEPEASDRFTVAAFGSISQVSPGELQGTVSWPGAVIGTVLGSADGVSAQSHLAHMVAASPAPLRSADLQSLILALHSALAISAIDPTWQQLLTFAEQALP
jgi:hypothetical protein